MRQHITVDRPAVSDEARYEDAALARVENVLEAEFGGRVSRARIAAVVATARARFRDVAIHEHVPVLVERQAREELNRTVEPG